MIFPKSQINPKPRKKNVFLNLNFFSETTNFSEFQKNFKI